ncbi:MAG: zinc ABC transporter substrate-binding protein [Pseudomonadota bacterium]
MPGRFIPEGASRLEPSTVHYNISTVARARSRLMRFRSVNPIQSIVIGGLLVGGGVAADEAPAVVASIKPIHSLVAGVMEGVGTPELLIGGAGSPHRYALRPSQARSLANADVVFWVGEGLETFLSRPIDALSDEARVISLGALDTLTTHPAREGGVWGEHIANGHADHLEDHEGHAEVEHHGYVDMHLWLDPQNGRAMIDAIAKALVAADPGHAETYKSNANGLHTNLARLDADLADKLAPVRNRPFVVFHDAYQYFENHYGLNAVGAITIDPVRKPGAGRLRAIRAKLTELEAVCVFAEPQFEPVLVETVVEGTRAKAGILDPLGAELEAGSTHYEQLLRSLSEGLLSCLGPSQSG